MQRIYTDILFTGNTEPIRQGMLVLDDSQRIISVLQPENVEYNLADARYFPGALSPGFVNTHCHLELSHLRGAMDEGLGLDNFVESLMQKRNSDEQARIKAMENADNRMFASGIVAVGDISNGSSSFSLKALSHIHYHTFIERFGLSADVAESTYNAGLVLLEALKNLEIPGNLVPHSPYSVSQKLLDLIVKHCFESNQLLSIHHQESASEMELFENQSGKMIERFERMKINRTDFSNRPKSSAEWLANSIEQDQAIMLVHNTFSQKSDIEFIHNKTRNAFWCLCPNANWFISRKLPNIKMLQDNNCCITLGTDSLASNSGLDMIDEMRTIQKHQPETSLSELFKWATFNGAKALDILSEFGSFETRKKPGIVHIENVDTINMLILPKTTSRIL